MFIGACGCWEGSWHQHLEKAAIPGVEKCRQGKSANNFLSTGDLLITWLPRVQREHQPPCDWEKLVAVWWLHQIFCTFSYWLQVVVVTMLMVSWFHRLSASKQCRLSAIVLGQAGQGLKIIAVWLINADRSDMRSDSDNMIFCSLY